MSGEFKVEVVDRFSKGIAGAQVVVQGGAGLARTSSEAVHRVETGFNGRAVFSLEAGTYLVSASKPEYRAEPREAKIRVAAQGGQASPPFLQIMLLPRIDSEDLADDAVGYEQIGADAVQTYQIAPGAVGTGQLADDAVEYEHIAADAVAGYQIADDSVGADHLADKAVTGDKIADRAIVARHIAPGSVALESLSEKVRATLASGAVAPKPPTPKPVASRMIVDGAVTGAKIGPAAISTQHLSAELQAATSPVAGRIIVAKEGGDYASLGDAVAALGASSKIDIEASQPVVIDVMPGVYEESSGIRLPAQVSLRGAGRECTEIRFATGGLTVDEGNECAISSLAILSPNVALHIQSSAVRVDNCFLSGGDVGISAEASTLLARGNIVRKGARGIRVLGCALRLLSNEIEQLTVCGLEIRRSNARVLWNTFLDNARDLDVREMQGGRRCLVSFNILRDIVADWHARTRVYDAQNLTAAAGPLEPWEDL